jgi:hypothetical protein
MTDLSYSVYVAPSKYAVSDDLPPGEARRMWSPTASTLVQCGEPPLRPVSIDRTRRYIEDFVQAAERADDVMGVYDAMVEQYPGRVNRGVLWNSVKTYLLAATAA